MKIPKQFSLGVLLIAVSVIAGFISGRQYGYNDGFANWQSLPMEDTNYSAARIVETDGNSEQTLLRLISDLREHLDNTVPKFRGEDQDFSVIETPQSGGIGVSVRGNTFVQTTVDRYLRDKEVAVLLKASNGKLSEADIERYKWARANYFEMKDLVGE